MPTKRGSVLSQGEKECVFTRPLASLRGPPLITSPAFNAGAGLVGAQPATG
jgi:hypothetical protein